MCAVRLSRRREGGAAPNGTVRDGCNARHSAPKSLGAAIGRRTPLVEKIAFMARTPGSTVSAQEKVHAAELRHFTDRLHLLYCRLTLGLEANPVALQSDLTGRIS
jgi:hypothetical protein